LTARSVLITGSTDGLGRACARELAATGHSVVVHGRDRAKAERVAEALQGDRFAPTLRGGGASVLVADLASLAEVRRLAEEAGALDSLDVLVNNAGTVAPERRTSADGHELTFAVNYLAGFALTLPLVAGERPPARVVNVASIGQTEIDFDDVMLERGYDGYRAYAQSKLAQVMFTLELAERLGEGARTTVTALHPATLMDTTMVRQTFGSGRSTVEEGMRATVRLAVGDDVEGVTGRYFDGLEESRADPQAYDPEARRRLWELSERLTGVSL
jgi:NAD(P)-dependent dehydrogenase (short-subunit alcohol dehydrogenase family)